MLLNECYQFYIWFYWVIIINPAYERENISQKTTYFIGQTEPKQFFKHRIGESKKIFPRIY